MTNPHSHPQRVRLARAAVRVFDLLPDPDAAIRPLSSRREVRESIIGWADWPSPPTERVVYRARCVRDVALSQLHELSEPHARAAEIREACDELERVIRACATSRLLIEAQPGETRDPAVARAGMRRGWDVFVNGVLIHDESEVPDVLRSDDVLIVRDPGEFGDTMTQAVLDRLEATLRDDAP